MIRTVDRFSLAAGLGLMATGGVLLAEQEGAFELSFGFFGALLAGLLAVSGASLLWRGGGADESVAAPAMGEILSGDTTTEALPARSERDRLRDLYRGGFGIALIAGAALIVLSRAGAIDTLGNTIVTTMVAILALALILAPFWWRLGRNLANERAERIRSQERAALAAHIHDSVLQTLTLVQKRASDPKEVAQLARKQERELRGWLFDDDKPPPSASLASALAAAAAEVEDTHRVPVEVVSVGDGPMDPSAEALVAAAREAMVNAAKFATETDEVAVYAELGPQWAEVFVRDRGPGFDPQAIPDGRQGVRESIIGRMERVGGTARIRSGPEGTEIKLETPLGEAS